MGTGLGANFALEVAARHPDLAGVVLEDPLEKPTDAIFRDPRSRLVPAHWLVRDRFDPYASAASLRIRSLWFVHLTAHSGAAPLPAKPEAFQNVTARKMLVWLPATGDDGSDYLNALSRWLDDLQAPNPTSPVVDSVSK